MKGQYWSASKRAYMPASEMAGPHVENAYQKLRAVFTAAIEHRREVEDDNAADLLDGFEAVAIERHLRMGVGFVTDDEGDDDDRPF